MFENGPEQPFFLHGRRGTRRQALVGAIIMNLPSLFCHMRWSILVLVTQDIIILISSMIPEILLLVKQIRPRTTQINNLGAAVPILFQPRAFEAVKGVRDTLFSNPTASANQFVLQRHRSTPNPLPSYYCSESEEEKEGRGGGQEKESLSYLSTTNDAFILVVSKRALVADAHQRRRPHVAVAHGALAVAFVAEAADGDACGFAAHY